MEELYAKYEKHIERFSKISNLTDKNVQKFKDKVFSTLSRISMYNEVYSISNAQLDYLDKNQIDIINRIEVADLSCILLDDFGAKCHWLVSTITEDSTLEEVREFLKDLLFLDYKLKVLELEILTENLDSGPVSCILTNSIMYTVSKNNIKLKYEMEDFIKIIL